MEFSKHHFGFQHIIILVGLIMSAILPSNAQSDCLDWMITSEILSIEEDNDFLYLGTDGNGLIKHDKNTQQSEYLNSQNSSLNEDVIKSLLFHDQNLYLSTDSSLYKYTSGDFILVNESIEGKLAHGMNNDLLIAGRRDFYILQNDSIIYHQDLMQVVQDACCNQFDDLTMDHLGNIWLVRHDFYEYDVLRFDGATWNVYGQENSVLPIESWQTNGLARVDNTVIAGNVGGLFKFENEEWTILSDYANPTIFENQDTIFGGITAMETDNSGGLWIAGLSGHFGAWTTAVAFNGNEGWKILTDESLNDPFVNIIFPSPIFDHKIHLGTTNGLLTIDKTCLELSTSTQEIQNYPFSIFPNPASDVITIQTGHIKDDEYSLGIYNSNGSLIYESIENGRRSVKVNLTHIPDGLYFVVIKTAFQHSFGKLFVTRN